MFALDSIPAVLGVSRDPFVLYTSNVTAVLGLRSLFFVLSSLLARLRYLKPALAVVLGFVGLKMILEDVDPGPGVAVAGHHRRGAAARLPGLLVEGPGQGAVAGAERTVSMTVAPRAGAGHGARRSCPAPSPRGSGSPSSRASGPSAALRRVASSPSPTRCEISNEGTVAAQLRSRHWIITDANGHVEEVKGEGVVGETPRLGPGERFEYRSWAMLRTPFGTMRGSYTFVRAGRVHLPGAHRRVRVDQAQRAELMDSAPPGRAAHQPGNAGRARDRGGAPLPPRVPERPAGAGHPAGRSCGAALRGHPPLPAASARPRRTGRSGCPRARRCWCTGSALRDRLEDSLGPGWAVELGMRYGKPSLGTAMEKLRARGVRELTVVPLYPQYASSSTGSSLERVYRLVGEAWNVEALRVLPPFYDRPAFLDAFADVARPVLAEARPEHVLFSFHGLPERQVRKSDPTGAHCLARADCCDTRVPANRWCYRMQSFPTARELAAAARARGRAPGR